MPYEDDTFDLCWSMESGEHMPDKRYAAGLPCYFHWVQCVSACLYEVLGFNPALHFFS